MKKTLSLLVILGFLHKASAGSKSYKKMYTDLLAGKFLYNNSYFVNRIQKVRVPSFYPRTSSGRM